MKKERLIYLSAPYTHPEKEVQAARLLLVNRFAAKIISEDRLLVYSPLSHGAAIFPERCPVPTEFWRRHESAIMQACSELWVLELEGWEQSIGVAAEIRLAEELGLPVKRIQVKIEELP